jgi:hypothetical protein
LCHTTSTLTSDDDMKQLSTALFDGAVRFDEGHHIVKLSPQTFVTQEALMEFGRQMTFRRVPTMLVADDWKRAYGEHARKRLADLAEHLMCGGDLQALAVLKKLVDAVQACILTQKCLIEHLSYRSTMLSMQHVQCSGGRN